MPKLDEWKEATSLRDTLYAMFERGEVDSPNFKAIVQAFGRPKIAKIWEDWKHQKKEQGTNSVGGIGHEF